MKRVLVLIMMMYSHCLFAQEKKLIKEFKDIKISKIENFRVVAPRSNETLFNYGNQIMENYNNIDSMKRILVNVLESSYKQNNNQDIAIKKIADSIASIQKQIKKLEDSKKADKDTVEKSLATIRQKIDSIKLLISEQITKKKYHNDSTYFVVRLNKKIDSSSVAKQFQELNNKLDSCCRITQPLIQFKALNDTLNSYFNLSNPKKDFKFITQLNDTLKKKSLDIIKIDAARKKDFHMLDSTLKIIPPILVKYSDSLRELDTKIMALKDTAQIMNYVGVLLHSSTEIGLSYWRNFQKLILGLETWSSFQNPDFKNAFGVRIAGGYLFKNKLMPNIGLDYFSKSVINMNVKPPVKEKENKFGVSFGVSVNTKKLTIGVFYSTVSHAGMRFLYAW